MLARSQRETTPVENSDFEELQKCKKPKKNGRQQKKHGKPCLTFVLSLFDAEINDPQPYSFLRHADHK